MRGLLRTLELGGIADLERKQENRSNTFTDEQRPDTQATLRECFIDFDSPRILIFGEIGSGKTTLLSPIARCLSESRVRLFEVWSIAVQTNALRRRM